MLLVFTQILFAQESLIFIDEISVSGNKHTKEGVIFRELHFNTGDSISTQELTQVLKTSEESLLNTGLFNSVRIFFIQWEASTGKIHIRVEIEEAWFVYPVPVFELADRNFNVWWVEQERALDRIKFGIEFTHLNLTGRRDRLKLTATYGYTRLYALKYAYPYLNKAKTLGITGAISFQRKREINYANIGNKQFFYKNENAFIYQKASAFLGLSYRSGHHLIHEWGFSFNKKELKVPEITTLNPFYFDNGKDTERAFSMSYAFTYDFRDIHAYPLNGTYFQFKITKPGLGIFKDKNILLLALRYKYYHQIADKWSTGFEFFGKTSLIRNQPPFENYRIMGSSSTTVPGYEYYVLNGLDATLLKTIFRFKLVDFTLKFGRLMPLQAFKALPIKIWLRANNGFGYANDPFDSGENPLNKKLLWGGGPALDLIFFHDFIFRFEYSFNRLGEKGLFLHFKASI